MIKEQQELFTTNAVTKKVKTGLSNGRGTLLLAIFGIAISLASSFMFCLASIGFDFSELRETVFWSRWASMSVSSFCAYAFVAIHKDEVNRLIPWYSEKIKQIADLSATVGEEFEIYLKELNERRRVEWYKAHINEKIAKLNRKMIAAELRNRPTDKIKAEIEKYRYYISDEYITLNKDALKTRSKPISSVQVLSETKKGDSREVNFRSASAYYGGKSVLKLCMSLVTTAAFSCVVVSNFGAGVTIASVVMTILTVLSLFISVFSAITAANGCYNNVYVPNILFKLKILADYDAWRKHSLNPIPRGGDLVDRAA